MANGWYRVKLAPFDSRDERDQAIREALAPAIEALERTDDMIKYCFFNHEDETREIMMNFYGDPWKLLEEIREAGWGHKIVPNMPETFHPTDERERFNDDYTIGVALFDLGCRLALASRRGRPLLEKGKYAIFGALLHAFYSGLVCPDLYDDDLRGAVETFQRIITTRFDYRRPSLS